MNRLFHRLIGKRPRGANATPLAAPSIQRRAHIRVEPLEDRQLLSITDLTGVAQLFPRHSGATVLYLNFDGSSSQGVSAFQSTTGNRTRDIHEILFRTSQIFAPFDVQVRRIYGNGNFDGSSAGNTTIFIGDKTGNGTGTANKSYAYTPWSSVDYPGDNKGIHHRPNSDNYDIAFVDGVSWNGSMNVSWSNRTIARAVAHEGGHTFGLAHVLSSPAPDVMSYNSSNTRFVNQTFDITDLNYNGSETVHDDALIPKWYQTVDVGWFHIDVPVSIVTQNSYTYLTAVLGARTTSGDYANVADTTAVDATYVDGSVPWANPGANITAYLQRTGDWDVFKLNTATSRKVVLNLKKITGSSVDPVLMIYNSTGQTLLAFNDDGGGYPNSKLVFQTTAGQTYKIVVGAYGANSSGGYRLTVGNYYEFAVIAKPIYKLSTNRITTSQLSTQLLSGMSMLGLAEMSSQSGHGHEGASHGSRPAALQRLLALLGQEAHESQVHHGRHGHADEAFERLLARRLAKKNDALYPHLAALAEDHGEGAFTHC